MLLLRGPQPALVDSGFTSHAEDTAAWIRAHTRHVALVVNTHWHSDHVGDNALLQATGAGIAASAPDAQAIARRDPGCCQAEYLDRPVSPYTVDEPPDDGQVLRLGDTDWQVVRTPGHTPGHLSLWQPEERPAPEPTGSGDRHLAQKCHVVHAPEHAAVCGLGHDQVLPAQVPERARRQGLAPEFPLDQPADQAVGLPQPGGPYVGLED